jgi:hypothetical protein
MQLAWMAFPCPYVDLKSPFFYLPKKKNNIFPHICTLTVRKQCICRFLHYSPCTSGVVLKIKNYVGFPCHVARSMILELPLNGNALTIPSVPFEGYKLSHIQALERKRIQLLRAKILGEISLHIESASLYP